MLKNFIVCQSLILGECLLESVYASVWPYCDQYHRCSDQWSHACQAYQEQSDKIHLGTDRLKLTTFDDLSEAIDKTWNKIISALITDLAETSEGTLASFSKNSTYFTYCNHFFLENRDKWQKIINAPFVIPGKQVSMTLLDGLLYSWMGEPSRFPNIVIAVQWLLANGATVKNQTLQRLQGYRLFYENIARRLARLLDGHSRK
ncbi:MAG: hypothetical protein LBB11_04015 [Puniceicoccales bacterium]|jgi:hypothetical protein|nr:hypothetical protein [Puniceicoccales bacterium]